MINGIPIAVIILVIVALVLGLFSALDKKKADGGSQLKRRIWIRTALIMLAVSTFVLVMNNST